MRPQDLSPGPQGQPLLSVVAAELTLLSSCFPELLQGLAQASCSTKHPQAAEFPSRVSSCSSLSQLCSLFPPAALPGTAGPPSPPSAPLMFRIEFQLCTFPFLHPRCSPALAQGSGLWVVPAGGNCHSSGTSARVLLPLLGCSVKAENATSHTRM